MDIACRASTAWRRRGESPRTRPGGRQGRGADDLRGRRVRLRGAGPGRRASCLKEAEPAEHRPTPVRVVAGAKRWLAPSSRRRVVETFAGRAPSRRRKTDVTTRARGALRRSARARRYASTVAREAATAPRAYGTGLLTRDSRAGVAPHRAHPRARAEATRRARQVRELSIATRLGDLAGRVRVGPAIYAYRAATTAACAAR